MRRRGGNFCATGVRFRRAAHGSWIGPTRAMKRCNQRSHWVTCQSCRPIRIYRQVFSHFDKLDVLFVGFIVFALIFEALRFSVDTP
jgi:hypothetical protein